MIQTMRLRLCGDLLPVAVQGTGVSVDGTHVPAAADAFAVPGAPPPRGAPPV